MKFIFQSRWLSLVLSFLLMFSFSSTANSLALGDINSDGHIDATDALLVLQSAVKLRFFTPAEQEQADVNHDQTVNATDALLILQYTVGLMEKFEPESKPEPPAETNLILTENGFCPLPLVAIGNQAALAAKVLQTKWMEAYGTAPALSADPSSPCIRISVGNTALGAHGYSLSIEAGSLVIEASDAEALGFVLGRFSTEILQVQQTSGRLCLSRDSLMFRSGDTPFTLAEAIAAGLAIEAKSKKLFSCNAKTIGNQTFKVAQGACTDDQFIYITLRTDDDAAAIVVKTDFQGTPIGQSAPCDLGHANDMTYDSRHNRLIIAHGSSSKNTKNGNDNGRRLSFMNPDTLKLTHTQANLLPSGYGAGALAYEAFSNVFLISRGGKAFRTVSVTADYQVTSLTNPGRVDRTTEGSQDYTAQGMGTDGKYVYFPMSGKTDNILVVYTLDARYVRTLHLAKSLESESLFFKDGIPYLCYYSNGAEIHRVNFTAVYQ